VRQKIDLSEKVNLGDVFHDELAQLIPELGSLDSAKKFWKAYRHRLLHVVTSEDCLAMTYPFLVSFDNGQFFLNPVKFTELVIQIVEEDFKKFEDANPDVAFPVIYDNI
jgi:hypothetical protein